MSVPPALLDVFTAIMLAVAAISAARLAAARPWRGGPARGDADIDGAHLLMGVAMAGTLAPALATLPRGAWEAVFAVLGAWFAGRVAREAAGPGLRAVARSHHAPHLVHSAAMLYMFAALTTPTARAAATSGMGAAGSMGTLRAPTIALAFLLILAGYAVTDLDGLTVARPRRPAAGTLAPELAMAAPVPVAAAEEPAAAPAGTMAGETPAPPPADAAVSGTPRTAGLLDPRLATGCRIAMGVTMALMLVLMI